MPAGRWFRKALSILSRHSKSANPQNHIPVDQGYQDPEEVKHILDRRDGHNVDTAARNDDHHAKYSRRDEAGPESFTLPGNDPCRSLLDLPPEVVLNISDVLEQDSEPDPQPCCTLSKLPPELILSITDYLSQESRVLLSLSCKRLRSQLASCLDLTMPNVEVRTIFLRRLEIDYPEFLTCRICGWMFLWQKTRSLSFTCPHSDRHPRFADQGIRQSTICIEHSIFINHEVRELILRAHSRGPQYGLPLSYLSSNCVADDQVSCKSLARIVDGQLVLATHWTLASCARRNMVVNLHALNQALCLHRWRVISLGFYSRIALKASDPKTHDEPVSASCYYCATDYKAHVKKLDGNSFQIILEVWQNFGNGCTDPLDVQQTFHTAGSPPKFIHSGSSGEIGFLEALFNSREGPPKFGATCQHESDNERTINEKRFNLPI